MLGSDLLTAEYDSHPSFLAVHNSSICDLVTHSVTELVSEPLLILEHKERPLIPVTFEILDQSDEET